MSQQQESPQSRLKRYYKTAVHSTLTKGLAFLCSFIGAAAVLGSVLNINLTPVFSSITSHTGHTVLLGLLLAFAIVIWDKLSSLIDFISGSGFPRSVATDGGQPRGPDGKFVSQKSDRAGILLVLLGGGMGYLVGTEVPSLDPLAGALIGGVVLWLLFR